LGSPVRTFTVSSGNDDAFVAKLGPAEGVTVRTTPAGLTFNVDGTDYSTTQTFTWVPGSTHTISTTTPQNGDPGVRYYFSNWSDGGAISHTVAPTKNTTYTAKFGTQYYLTMNAGIGGNVGPGSRWHSSGTTFAISATASNLYSFTNWRWLPLPITDLHQAIKGIGKHPCFVVLIKPPKRGQTIPREANETSAPADWIRALPSSFCDRRLPAETEK